ncbi:GTPase Era [Nitrosospira multiformis]|uniref:GTPase Era n=1 Tax=Nitrosospira multiformis (strain ATCC 25196 / NCIMB 11849 / C 71) TaxID=323848 RepID=Q2Y870_NITMU|nr:GTPase Era [Nitrosospira multiformis]ABB75051.1 GTP-binding protein Era [Nitrosospira multiformis ATCC 25196]SEA55665.1 GTP-binding protein Era [Nitrosospira multiformis]SEF83841.1 GTP-binding protein Era [Nitrosospira multiformis ATCC 25196]
MNTEASLADPVYRSGYIAIVGRPNVGKSTLLNRLVGQKISITSKKSQTTRHRIHGIFTDEYSQFVFVDTPGFQTRHTNRLNSGMNRLVTQTLRDVDIVILVIEAMRFDDRDKLVVKLLPKSKPVVLALNKIDRLTDKSQLLPFLEKMSKEFDFAAMVPISAENGGQLPELIAAIRPHLPQNPPLFLEDEVTDRDERFIAAELVREKLFRLLGEEIPYSTSVIIDQFTVEDELRRIHASIVVDKSSQKAIVIGKDGEKLKLIATQARKDMEESFGGKVYLKIWVKIKSGWAEDARMLKTLGYE